MIQTPSGVVKPEIVEQSKIKKGQKLGIWTATALVVGNMIGSGVFLLPASLAPYGGMSVFGWLFTSSGAMILAYLFAPVSFVIGVPWDEAFRAGTFLGEKVVLNEFLAYLHFSPEIGNFSERGQVAITVALCGFANLTGLAVLIAGLKSIVPDRGTEIARLGLKFLRKALPARPSSARSPNWASRRPKPWIMPTRRALCIGTSSRRT